MELFLGWLTLAPCQTGTFTNRHKNLGWGIFNILLLKVHLLFAGPTGCSNEVFTSPPTMEYAWFTIVPIWLFIQPLNNVCWASIKCQALCPPIPKKMVNKAAMVYALRKPGLERTTVITSLMITKDHTENKLSLRASPGGRTKDNACPSRDLKSRRPGSPLWRVLPSSPYWQYSQQIPHTCNCQKRVLFSLSSHFLLIVVATPSGFQILTTI